MGVTLLVVIPVQLESGRLGASTLMSDMRICEEFRHSRRPCRQRHQLSCQTLHSRGARVQGPRGARRRSANHGVVLSSELKTAGPSAAPADPREAACVDPRLLWVSSRHRCSTFGESGQHLRADADAFAAIVRCWPISLTKSPGRSARPWDRT